VHAFSAQARPITNEDVSRSLFSSWNILTSSQYARYLEQAHISKIPASWAEQKTDGAQTNGCSNGHTNGHTNGNIDSSPPLTMAYLEGKSVRTVYGLVPLKYALDWPVSASYDELAGCASWMGGRIPTAEEARSIYSRVDGLKLKEAEQHLGKTVPAVNG
jgi:hypothetical protein